MQNKTMKKLKPDFYMETDRNVFIIYKNFLVSDDVNISGDKNILTLTYISDTDENEKTLIFPTDKFFLKNLHYEVNNGNLFLVVPKNVKSVASQDDNEEVSVNTFYVIE